MATLELRIQSNKPLAEGKPAHIHGSRANAVLEQKAQLSIQLRPLTLYSSSELWSRITLVSADLASLNLHVDVGHFIVCLSGRF